jgi:toxin ParE1/3/4
MYELSDAAAEDVEKILNRSLIDFGLHQTELYYISLKTCLELLGENPGIGTPADDLRPGYRRFVHESHVIFYRQTVGGMLVVRILHKRMDIDKHLDSRC